MSMITELFGQDILNAPLWEVKQRIKLLPKTQQERRSYLLHDWAAATGIKLLSSDFDEVESYNKE